MRKLSKEEKIGQKKARRNRRIQKRKDKDKVYLKKALEFGHNKVSVGRRITNGSHIASRCEMGYYDCEARGYCNYDC